MTNLIPFSFKNHEVRTTTIQNICWFAAHDVAAALEYSEASALTRHLDDDEKGLSTIQTPGGEQQIQVINESGLYHALFKSRKPEAKAFRKWVTGEVLPAIRKTGKYERQGLTPAQQRHIQKRVAELASTQVGTTYQGVYRGIKDQFNVGTYKDVPAEQYPELCRFLECEPLEGEYIEKTSAPAKQYHYPMESITDVEPYRHKAAWLTAQTLTDVDSGHPLADLLNELTSNGCDVNGARAEYLALMSRLKDYYDSMARMRRQFDRLAAVCKETIDHTVCLDRGSRIISPSSSEHRWLHGS